MGLSTSRWVQACPVQPRRGLPGLLCAASSCEAEVAEAGGLPPRDLMSLRTSRCVVIVAVLP